MSTTKYILFDVAETLLHKPVLLVNYQQVLIEKGFDVPFDELRLKHKLVSEMIRFPDVTSENFYTYFNTELLHSLGILETPALLQGIFHACKYLPWEPFDDVDVLSDLDCRLGIISNFNKGLRILLKEKLPEIVFSDIFISEELQMAKPDAGFFQHAISEIGLEANEILYVGDSFKLDVAPALNLGLRVKLVDRNRIYPSSKYRIETLRDLI